MSHPRCCVCDDGGSAARSCVLGASNADGKGAEAGISRRTQRQDDLAVTYGRPRRPDPPQFLAYVPMEAFKFAFAMAASNSSTGTSAFLRPQAKPFGASGRKLAIGLQPRAPTVL